MSIFLLRTGSLKAIPWGSISHTVFCGVLITVFPNEFHDPVNVESTELTKLE
jgi:hypothetical protein